MKDRDEQHYEHEESEYHFSDDDVSYEVETDASKPAAPEPVAKRNPLAGLTQSRRMLISLGVFLGLVFVVYKMVSPGSSVPQTDITPVVANAPAVEPPAIPHTTPPVVAATPAHAEPKAAPTPAPVSQPTVANASPAAPVTTTTTVTQQPIQQAQAVPPTPASVAAAPAPASVAPAPMPTAVPTPVASAVPPVPATSAAPAPIAAAPVQQALPVATTVTTTATAPTNTDAAIATMVATNEKLMNQLQAEYSQKVSDMSSQSRVMQDQMQTLSSRVAGLESQLSQLVQTLTRQQNSSLNVVPAQQTAPIVETKSNYNVQAIIPGRAWLKSDNGETLTVAEGDSIKELGRVTKIDPYDGVVEVNTGNKTVSISYGSGG